MSTELNDQSFAKWRYPSKMPRITFYGNSFQKAEYFAEKNNRFKNSTLKMFFQKLSWKLRVSAKTTEKMRKSIFSQFRLFNFWCCVLLLKCNRIQSTLMISKCQKMLCLNKFFSFEQELHLLGWNKSNDKCC